MNVASHLTVLRLLAPALPAWLASLMYALLAVLEGLLNGSFGTAPLDDGRGHDLGRYRATRGLRAASRTPSRPIPPRAGGTTAAAAAHPARPDRAPPAAPWLSSAAIPSWRPARRPAPPYFSTAAFAAMPTCVLFVAISYLYSGAAALTQSVARPTLPQTPRGALRCPI